MWGGSPMLRRSLWTAATASLLLASSGGGQDATVSCVERRCGAERAACQGNSGCAACEALPQAALRARCEDALLAGDRAVYDALAACVALRCGPCAAHAAADACTAAAACAWDGVGCVPAAATPSPSAGPGGRCCATRSTACADCSSWHGGGWCASAASNCELSCGGRWCAGADGGSTLPPDDCSLAAEPTWDARARARCCAAVGVGCVAPSLQACGCNPSRPATLAPTLSAAYAGDVCVGRLETWGAYCFAPDATGACPAADQACCNVKGYNNESARCVRETAAPDNSPVSGSYESCGCGGDAARSFVDSAYVGDLCVGRPADNRGGPVCSTTSLTGSCYNTTTCCNAGGYGAGSRTCGSAASPDPRRGAVRLTMALPLTRFRRGAFMRDVLESVRRMQPEVPSGVIGVRVEFVCPAAACCGATRAERLAAGCVLGTTCDDACEVPAASSAPATAAPCEGGAANCTDAASGRITVEFSVELEASAEKERNLITYHLLNEVNSGVFASGFSVLQGSATDVASVFDVADADGDDGDPACGGLCIAGLVVGIVVFFIVVGCVVLLVLRGKAAARRDADASSENADALETPPQGRYLGSEVVQMQLETPVKPSQIAYGDINNM